MSTPLRFAPLIRVSTENQEKKGESLRTQTDQIQHYVKTLGGMIPEYCWDYSGQEHATPDQERSKLKKLLSDSSKGIFDAVIVCDASRWSRDNAENKRGLKILRDNNIRFFVASMEYDLHSPEQSLFLGLAAEINEFQAKQQNLKSIQSRITRAKRGIPTTGKLPYGRTFDATTGKWGLDEQKVRSIQWAAQQYLAGKSSKEIAKTLNMHVTTLWLTLHQRAGDKWLVNFNPSSMNVNETVEMTIPRLLSEETIQAIHEKAKANKTYTHGEIKHKYLLSRMVFCSECGSALFGQTNHGGTQYYCHQKYLRNRCTPSLWVRADMLEEVVVHHLFNLFGDTAAMERAITRAIPDHSRLDALREEKTNLESKLTATHREKQNIIRSISKGILSDEEAGQQLQELRERENLLSSEINTIAPQLENVPTRERIERSAKMVQNIIRSAYSATSRLSEMTYEDKRELVQKAFAGKDASGRRRGVYVRKTGNKTKPWEFNIVGILAEFGGLLPFTESEMEDLDDTITKYALHWPVRSL